MSNAAAGQAPAGSLAGRVGIVTGGTKGIGAAIARRFLTEGADVVVCGRHEPDEPIGAGGRNAIFVAADVRDADQAQRLVESAADRFGRLDIVVNNAGGAPTVDTDNCSPHLFQRIVELNLLAPFYVSQAANAIMQRQDDGGVIINIGSVAGYNPAPNTAAYSSAKAGLTMLTRTLGMDFAPRVRVNQVTVGLVVTEQAHLFYGDAAGQQRVADVVPLRRMARPDDIADACLLLASPLAGYVTGAELRVDGGGEYPSRHLAAHLKP